jgi:hypothetical protein
MLMIETVVLRANWSPRMVCKIEFVGELNADAVKPRMNFLPRQTIISTGTRVATGELVNMPLGRPVLSNE